MNKYSLIGINPTRIIHSGTINGQLPTASGSIAEPSVSAGLARYQNLASGGLFAFDKKSIIVEELIGTFTIVDSEGIMIRQAPTGMPFKLYPGEWLKASSGDNVQCVVRLDAHRIL